MPGERKVRKRKLSGPLRKHSRSSARISTGIKFDITGAQHAMPGTQITESEGHQWPPPKGADLTDRGGAFRTTRSWVLSPTNMPVTTLTYVSPNTPSIREEYVGPIVAAFPGALSLPVFPPTLESTDANLEKKGAIAVSKCKPTNSVADLSTFLGELMKEGLPSLVGSQTWKARTSAARRKAVGGEYLNYQFGIAPVLSEVSNIAQAIKKSDKILAQYERDAGRVVRRKYGFPSEKSVTEVLYLANGTSGWADAGYTTARNAFKGEVRHRRETVRNTWFSGAFTYHLPTGYESRDGISKLAAQADKLFGIKPGPEVLWNLAPWSWAIDWFSNTGDVISNLEDFKLHGLIMRYGYIMEETSVTDTYTFVNDRTFSVLQPRVADVVLRTLTKKRLPANPFGFGVTWNGISPFQASIAAALGISRGR